MTILSGDVHAEIRPMDGRTGWGSRWLFGPAGALDGRRARPQFADMAELSHMGADGSARMVDVSAKPLMLREAVAAGEIRMAASTLALIESNRMPKGDVFATARLAGILAAKRTGDLIPLCHPLPITHCSVDFAIPPERDRVLITASAKIAAPTGVEMEALTAVTVAALTLYDMCKAVDKAMVIGDVRLVSKTKRTV